MFIEIKNLYKAKKLLNLVYKKSKSEFTLNNIKYLNIKYLHLFDCLKILRKINTIHYYRYAPTILLHDIGRFLKIDDNKSFDHAQLGFEYLKNNYSSNPLVILPIKYHESDDNCLKKLREDDIYINCSEKIKEEIEYCCLLLIDIDIISNMKAILNKKVGSNIDKINMDIVDKLKNDKLGDKKDIKNYYDEIVYILCGLKIISLNKSIKYLKKTKLIKKIIDKLYLISNNDLNKNITINIENIIKEKYNL